MEHKTSKYIKYAVGEIILVVFGILIALQINNWNEQSKTIQSANVQLNLLMQNISDDLLRFKELNTAIKSNMITSTALSEQFQEIRPFDKHTTRYIITNLFEQNFDGNSAVYNRLILTGEFSVLPQSLQKKITEYYKLVDQIKEREEISNTFIKKELEPHFFDNYSLYNRKENNLHPILIEYYKNDKRQPIPLNIEVIKNDSKMEALNFARFYQSKTQQEFYVKAIQMRHEIKQSIGHYLNVKV